MNNWPRNPVLYEINTPIWLYDLSRKYGGPVTLANVPAAEWDSLAALQINAVWFMGVWERSPIGIQVSNQNAALVEEFRKALPDYDSGDNIGSAYCIREYQVDDRWGGNQGLAAARAALSSRGIHLLLDYVPNHVARDHSWVQEHPEYFIHGEIDDLLGRNGYYFEANEEIIACGKDPFFPPWEDVAQLNAFHSGLRIAATDTVLRLAAMCDGIRCDMAMLMLNEVFNQTWAEKAGPVPKDEFWTEIIQTVRSEYPDFIFLAESYWDKEPELHQLGFDFCYDKKLYDHLVAGRSELIISDLGENLHYQERLIRFIENHDEARALTAFPIRKSLIAAIALATVPGGKLFYEGQFEGRRVRTPVFLRRRAMESVSEDQVRFYQLLVKTAASDLIQLGEWFLCSVTGWKDNTTSHFLAAWSWRLKQQVLLVVLNFGESNSQGLVRLPWDSLAGSNWRLVDLIKGDVFERSGDDMVSSGLYVDLPPSDFHLLWFSRKI